jgi:hypothetical protein
VVVTRLQRVQSRYRAFLDEAALAHHAVESGA